MKEYLELIESLIEVDRRPKNILLETNNSRVTSMYDRPLPLKEQLEALAAAFMEAEILREEQRS